MTHTPRPWEISYSTNFPDQQTIQAVGSDRILAVIDRADEQDIANAHLIAAAPDLLEALKDLIEAADDPDNERPSDLVDQIDWKGIRSAIAKAEGRQS